MFSYNRFKTEIISSIPQDEQITVYRVGDFVDLCRGPHLPSTEKIKAFRLIKNSGVYWRGNKEGPLLNRLYGISFPSQESLVGWEKNLEEVKARDHRIIGKTQQLFWFHPFSPGSAFFLPHGTRIFNRLLEFLREEYRQAGYQEVITPLIFHTDLWKQSGHWDHYRDDMFLISHSDEHKEGLKPMNCPGHCLIFKSTSRSYKDLPIRLADFSPLHRNEEAGALTGLTRGRKFHQDDAHIFCTEDQLSSELENCLQLVERVYGRVLALEYNLALSTRPDSSMGDPALWDKAEAALMAAASRSGRPLSIKDKDGAFYGPKLDVSVKDALGRFHQCATIQCDFNLPQRFGLEFVREDGSLQTPVIVHRAILGSVERLIAIYSEHVAGNWPFWLSPRQCLVVPVGDKHVEYAEEVCRRLSQKEKFYVDVARGKDMLGKKVREAWALKYNYVAVVGDREVENASVSLRARDGSQLGLFSVEQLTDFFLRQASLYSQSETN
eukprot:TRINITY_DN552_c0_g1_i2.p1 TRINITY_DN552_c0_g1~~TRINITY_DN552_c0_g1_i2.p1  ORF type:complete len:495 (+),score=82.03 TRINITY_DN552_c0_g1_i2:698-2182(+)